MYSFQYYLKRKSWKAKMDPSTANMCKAYDFYDKSMKLCTVLKHDISRNFGYMDITDMPCEKMAAVFFFKMAINGYRQCNNTL